jgi:hypothetical protein
MPKPVKGFMTDKGNFFENEEEAEFHEADQDLRDKILDAGFDPDKFTALAVRFNSETRRYVNAYFEINKQDEEESRDAISASYTVKEILNSIDADTANETGRAEDNAPAELQSPDRRSAVSDMGSGPRTEAVPDKRKIDGT